jgi:hypothetical protein
MRAGPLANSKVIDLLNRYFIPVYVSNEDYRPGGSVPPEERAEKDRIYLEALKAGLSAGTVHVYIVRPDGRTIDSLHVATAAKSERLIEMLERDIHQLGTQAGKPLRKPAAQSTCPQCESGALALHLTARSLRPGGAWGEFPVENWIVLRHDECTKLLPAGKMDVGTTWKVDDRIAEKLLLHFYPATENNDIAKNKILEKSLTGRVLSLQEGLARVRLDGELRMKHSFYHREDGNVVRATIVGLCDVEVASGKIRSVRMATHTASYGRGTFGVVVHSVP